MAFQSYPLIAFIATRDAARAKAFYQNTLGLKLIEESPYAVVFEVNGVMLRVTPVPEISIAKYTVLGWHVPDIAVAARELLDAGVAFERFPGLQQDELGVWHTPGAKVAWFKDPDGNILSISQH